MTLHTWIGAPVAALVFVMTACAHGDAVPTGPDWSDGEARGLTASDIERSRSGAVADLLAGRVAGVHVAAAADGGIAIRIRGSASIQGGTAPLYVVDGLPVQPGPGGVLSAISPGEIESIQVLKDATDMTMYGARGANGVIVIRTKQADR